MTQLDSGDNHQSLLSLDNPLFQRPWGVLQPQTIPCSLSSCNHRGAFSQFQNLSATRGVAALGYVRAALELESEGVTDAELLRRVISQSLIDEASAVAHLWDNADNHSEVEDLLKAPVLQEAMIATSTLRPVPGPDTLRKVISHWFPQTSTRIQAAVFSNYSEIAACLQIPIAGSSVYALLDCHPRPHHPEGPAITLTHEVDEVVSFLRDTIFRGQDDFSNSGTNSQSSAHRISSTIYANKPTLNDDPPVESAKSISAVSAQSSLIRTQRVRTQSDRHRRTHSKSISSSSLTKENLQLLASGSTSAQTAGPHSNVAGSHPRGIPSWQLSLPMSLEQQDQTQDHIPLATIPMPLFANNKEKVPIIDDKLSEFGTDLLACLAPFADNKESTSLATLPPALDISSRCSECAEDVVQKTYSPSASELSWQALLVQQLQEEENMSALKFKNGAGEHAWRLVAKRLHEEDTADPQVPGPSSLDLDWQIALQLQQEEMETNNATSHRIRAPTTFTLDPEATSTDGTSTINTLVLPAHNIASVECGICAEMHAAEGIMTLSGCGHHFCKDCLTNFAISKIEDGRYPIFCPECLVERPRAEKTVVSDEIFQQLELPREKLTRLAELQMVAHAIALQCPRCKESMHIDKDQYAEEKVIVCPLPRCGHKWCKSCLKTLASSDDRHRCKNSNIDRLMRRKGWKYCPGCRTPVQKESGCNHMTCGTPGCNVHFCYKCGVLMIDTTNGGDVGTTVTEHYMNCRLFERKWKCNIQ